nr:immunoglobulin heavy chain junction region [Mus musculus]
CARSMGLRQVGYFDYW